MKLENAHHRSVRSMFWPTRFEISIYLKNTLTFYMAVLDFTHILRDATKPTVLLTDNNPSTNFIQTRVVPPTLWMACDDMLPFNFKTAHIAGWINTAVDVLSGLELKVTEKFRLKSQDGIQTTPADVTTFSSDKADEEQSFFTNRQRKWDRWSDSSTKNNNDGRMRQNG